MCLDIIVMRAFDKKGVERNSCTISQCLHRIKLFNIIAVEGKTLS